MDLIDKVKLLIGTTIVGGIIVVPFAAKSYFHKDSIVTTINETAIKRYGDADKFLVFTDDEVYQNSDSLFYHKFRSANIQNKIMKLKGKNVEITKYGWRIPL